MLAKGQAAPLRFLLAVLLAWTTMRGIAIEGWNPFRAHRLRLGPPPGWLMEGWPAEARLPAPLARVREAVARATSRVLAVPPARPARPATRPVADAFAAVPIGPIRAGIAMSPDALRLIAIESYRPSGERTYARDSGVAEAAAIAGDPRTRAPLPRWSGSAWAFVRGGGRARPLSSDGQIGGGQAGARALYRIDDAGAVAASARVSRTIGGPSQAEAAVGVDWRPARSLPVHVTVERRVAIDRGGRDAFAAGVAGGVYAVPLVEGWRLDGYGEAGVVGLARRDLYADGAVRAGRELDLGGRATLTLGAGAWGAAQPRAARLDAGPSAVLRVPVAGHTVAAAVDYRARIAGDARPHSGAALTIGVDF